MLPIGSLQRQKMSSFDDFNLYASLGSLIKDYRRWRHLSQETFAESIGISIRELQRWEGDRRCARVENLHDFSEITGIPMLVCVALNVDQPVWYSLRRRRFAYSLMEVAQYPKNDLFEYCDQYEGEVLTNSKIVERDKDIDAILSYHRDLCNTARPLGRDVVKAACMILHDLNRIVFDCWGHHVGHLICLPIKLDVYQQVKRQRVPESYLTPERISDIVALHGGVFLFYYFFAASVNIRHLLTVSTLQYFAKIEPKERYLAANFFPSTIEEGKKFCSNLGMKRIFSEKGEDERTHTEVNPITRYEIELDAWMRSFRRFEALGRVIKEHDQRPGDRNLIGKTKRERLPAIPAQIPNDFRRDLSEFYSSINVDEPSLDVDKQKRDYQKEEKAQLYKLKTGTCPNPKCNLHGKNGKGNIVSNGTYRTKEGVLSRRFLCKACSKSFCTRTGTIFHDLRIPEQKVLRALELLIKGMPLQRAAEVLGIRFNTIRHWLEIAAEQGEEIDSMLMKELKVSQVELDTLWSFVRKNSLRQRAILWKTKANPFSLCQRNGMF